MNLQYHLKLERGAHDRIKYKLLKISKRKLKLWNFCRWFKRSKVLIFNPKKWMCIKFSLYAYNCIIYLDQNICSYISDIISFHQCEPEALPEGMTPDCAEKVNANPHSQIFPAVTSNFTNSVFINKLLNPFRCFGHQLSYIILCLTFCPNEQCGCSMYLGIKMPIHSHDKQSTFCATHNRPFKKWTFVLSVCNIVYGWWCSSLMCCTMVYEL